MSDRYSDVPKEFLLIAADPNKDAQCLTSEYFWVNYLKARGIQRLANQRFVLSMAKISQMYVVPMHKAIQLLHTTHDPVFDYNLLFISIIRKDSEAIEYFRPMVWDFNPKNISSITNKVIDILNDMQGMTFEELNKIFKRFFRTVYFGGVNPFLSIIQYHFVASLILDKMNPDAIEQILIFDEESPSYYGLFISFLVGLLAEKGSIGDAISLAERMVVNDSWNDDYAEAIMLLIPSEYAKTIPREIFSQQLYLSYGHTDINKFRDKLSHEEFAREYLTTTEGLGTSYDPIEYIDALVCANAPFSLIETHLKDDLAYAKEDDPEWADIAEQHWEMVTKNR